MDLQSKNNTHIKATPIRSTLHSGLREGNTGICRSVRAGRAPCSVAQVARAEGSRTLCVNVAPQNGAQGLCLKEALDLAAAIVEQRHNPDTFCDQRNCRHRTAASRQEALI